MERTYVSELKSGQNVLLKGWVYEIRNLAKAKFLLLRDVSGIAQCVLKLETKGFDEELTLESVIEISGKVKSAKLTNEELTSKNVEIDVSELKLLNKAEELPMQV